jgi:ABC-type phosphate/phosphonate transport system substrate-binding protein
MGGSAIGLRGASKQDTEATFNVYLSDLFKKSKSALSVSTVMYPDSKALLAAFDKGEIDGFFGTALEYISRKDHLCKTVAGIVYKNANLKQRFFIIARASDDVTQLSDLRNKRITLAPYMDAEALYLNTILLRNNLPQIPKFFREIKDARSPNIALMDVFFNKSDVAIVRENEYSIAVELNPQLGKKLIVLEKSEPYIATVGAINNKVSDEDFMGFIAEFNKVATTQEGQKLLDIISVDKISRVTVDEMKDLQGLLDENTALKQSLAANSIQPSVAGKLIRLKQKKQF